MLVWHDCKTDPPKKDGYYFLCFTSSNKKYMSYAWCNIKYNCWEDDDGYIINNSYKWAEVELPE